MIHAGQTIENPVTGERLVFQRTALQTGGAYTRFDAYIAPGGHLPTGHVHPNQTETFEIVSGTLTIKLDGRTIHARAGETVVIEPGTNHDFANETDEVVHFRAEVRPALKIESLIETMYGLAADGKTNRSGIPNPLRLAVIAGAHFDTVRLSFPPAFVQRAVLTVGAPIGRILGYRPEYHAASATVTAAREAELALSA
jgi:quercetin dioxygenase-like cupin family protein